MSGTWPSRKPSLTHVTRMETFCGTTGYASPEMLSGRKYLGVETDIWSLGIILYTLLSGGLPFDDDNEAIMKELILKGEYEEPEWLSEGKSPFVTSLCQSDPPDLARCAQSRQEHASIGTLATHIDRRYLDACVVQADNSRSNA